MRIHCRCLATHRRIDHRLVVAVLRLDNHGILLLTEFLEPANIRHNLRNADAHLLEVAQTPALTVCCRHTHIRQIVKGIDVLITEDHVLRRDHQTIGEMLDIHTTQLQLPLVQLEDPPTTLLTLVANAHKKNRLRRVLDDHLHKGHDQKIIALARLVAIHG